MTTVVARLAALTTVVLFLSVFASASKAGDVSELCRTSPHQKGGPASSAPDICAAIATRTVTGPAHIVPPSEIVDAIAVAANRAAIVLFGEIHDNPSHHKIRAQIIKAIAAQRAMMGKTAPGLVMEHVRADQAMAITDFRAVDRGRKRTADEFFDALEWSTSGWPDKEMFRPMIQAALEAAWPIEHGNVARQSIRAVARKGLSVLSKDVIADLRLDIPLPPTLKNDLLDELVQSHCGLMQRDALTTMADAQIYRDAYLARQVYEASRIYNGGVLVAGNGHIRADRGVPWHLMHIAPDRPRLSVIFLQAQPDNADVLSYAKDGVDGKPRADFIVVTPRVERPDPCAALKRRPAPVSR